MSSDALYSVIIPMATYHEHVAADAINSAMAQTVPGRVVVIHDSEGRGAGWARNRGVERATTPFVIFLDADDVLAPTFAEATLKAYAGTFVYTDALLPDGRVYETPDAAQYSIWQQGQGHFVTVLMPVGLHHVVGGFDETLPALEDTDYFLKLASWGCCGVRAPGALFTYRHNIGQRSKTLREAGQHQTLANYLANKYEVYRDMPCVKCGGTAAPQVVSSKVAAQDGDVIAETLYAPMKQVGPVTGRVYPRVRMGAAIPVSPADARHRPDWWRVVADVPTATPEVDYVQKLVEEALHGGA